jgi:hypothetical protein
MTGDEGEHDPAVAAFLRLCAPHPVLTWAEAELARRCVAEAGFADFPPPQPTSGRLTLQGFPTERSEDSVRRIGFGSDIVRRAVVDAYAEHRDRITAAEQRLLDTVVDDSESPLVEVTIPGLGDASAASRGCYARARVALYGGVEEFLQVALLPQGANGQINQLSTDTRIVAANATYVGRMARRGYLLRSWMEAPGLAQEFYDRPLTGPDQARARETILAMADLECLRAARLPQAYRAAVLGKALEWILEHGRPLVAADRVLTRAQRRADVVARAAGAPWFEVEPDGLDGRSDD